MRTASNEIEAKHSVDITLDEATSNSAGSPYIPYELAEKIRKADIYVADITTVVRHGPDNDSLPNPNVTFELGVASAQVGWSRTIMLFNSALAEFEKLPFDFDRHRISQYKMADDPAAIKSGSGALKSLLVVAIERIILDDPKRPRELEGKAPDEIKRSRDVENIKWFMRQINTGFLDAMVDALPQYLDWSAVFVADGVDGVIRSSDFQLYDQDVYEAMLGLQRGLSGIFKHEGHYRDTANPRRQSFGRRGNDFYESPEEEQAFKEIAEARNEANTHLQELIRLIRERYLEIDIDETNRKCAAAYAETISEG